MLLFYRLLLLFLLLNVAARSYGQQYLNARTMKLTEVSTDTTYGYEPDNPIKIGRGEHNVGFFLNALKAPRNVKFHVDDIKYVIFEHDTLEQVKLYFEGYEDDGRVTLFFLRRQFEQPKAPLLFTYKTLADLPAVTVFPADKIVQVQPCAPAAVLAPPAEHSLAPAGMLARRLGTLPPQPDTYPSYRGGPAALQKYFDAHPLTGELAGKTSFKTTILFLVTCKGKAGNYRILPDVEGRGDYETLVNQVLAPVNDLPQHWQPATKNGKPVDCYQILEFMVIKGRLTNVTYQ